MDANYDDEYQNAQFEIEELQRKEEELRKKMAALANKRRGSSRASLDDDEEDMLEIGKPRRGSSSNISQSKRRSGNMSPVSGIRPGSASPLKERSNLKGRRGSDRSHSTPETNVNDLKCLSFQRRRSSDKNISRSEMKKTDRRSADYSNESLKSDSGKLKTCSKGGQQSPKAASTGNLYGVEIPENTFKMDKYDKRSSSSLSSGKRGSRSSRDYDSFDIIEIDPPNSNRNEEVNEIMNNKLVNGEYQQNSSINEEDEVEDDMLEDISYPTRNYRAGSDSPHNENRRAWGKIEREFEEQKQRELEIQGLKRRGLSESEEAKERDEGEGNYEMKENGEVEETLEINSQLDVWEKIEMEIEEEKRRDEEMSMKNRIIFKEDIEGYDSEEEENDCSRRKSMGRIELEIEEQMRKEMEIKRTRSPEMGSEISDDESSEQAPANEGGDMYESVKTRINKELEEMRQRELELKMRLGLEGENESQEEDELKEDSYAGAKSKMTMEIEEFRKRESEFRKLHGVADDDNCDEEIDEGLEEETINDEEYSNVDEDVLENENDEISEEEDEMENVKDKHIDTFTKVEEEIAEQRKKDKEFKLVHNIDGSDEDELPVVHKIASGRNRETSPRPNRLVLPGVFAGAAIKQSRIQKKTSNQTLKPKVLKDIGVRDTTVIQTEKDNDIESCSSIEDEGISESFEEDKDLKNVARSRSLKKTTSRSCKNEEGNLLRQDQDLDSVNVARSLKKTTSRSCKNEEGNLPRQDQDLDSVNAAKSLKKTTSRSCKNEEGNLLRQDQDLDSVMPGMTRKFIQIFDTNKNDKNRGLKFEGNPPSKRKDEREFSRRSSIHKPVKEHVDVVQQEQNLLESITDTSIADTNGTNSNGFFDRKHSLHGNNPENVIEDNGALPEKGLPDPKPGKKLVLKKKKSKRNNEFSSDDDGEQSGNLPDVARPSRKVTPESKSKLKTESRREPKQTQERKQDGKHGRKSHPLALQFEKMEEEKRLDAELNDLKLQRKKQELEKKKQQELEEKQKKEEVEKEEGRQTGLQQRKGKRREMEQAWEQKKSPKELDTRRPKELDTRRPKELDTRRPKVNQHQNGLDKRVKKTPEKDTSPTKRQSYPVSKRRSPSPTKSAKSNIRVWEDRIQSQIQE